MVKSKTRKQKKIQKGGGVRINHRITWKRKISILEDELATLLSTPLPTTYGPRMTKIYQEERNEKLKKLRSDIETLEQKIKNLEPKPESKVKINTSKLYVSSLTTLDSAPIHFHIFVNSPRKGLTSPFGGPSGPQYTAFEKKLSSQIYALRKEGFPEEYGPNSQSFKDSMIKLFGKVIDPYLMPEPLLWISPFHCAAENNYMVSLLTKNEISHEPNLIANCALIECILEDIHLTELYGLATFKKYQKRGFGKDLLQRVLQELVNYKKGPLEKGYVWLYYRKESAHLKKLYESVGFKPIDERSTDEIEKRLYISSEFLLSNERIQKFEKYKEKIKSKNPYNIIIVEEENLPEYLKERKINLDAELTVRFRLLKKMPEKGVYISVYFQMNDTKDIDISKYFKEEEYRKLIQERYFNAWYSYMTERTKFLVIISKQEKAEQMTLSKEEEEQATEFLREEQQMVLCLADWVQK